MSNKPVNAGFGVKSSATYDIWFYKGGANCHHFWMRKTFMSKKEGSNPDVKNPNADISVNKAKKEGFKPEKNNIKVAKRPIDMPNNGYKNPR